MPLERLKTIGYITDMSKQMNEMARNVDLPFLAFLLDMVAKEGQNILKNNDANQKTQ
ncbi:hypothetical protein RAM19_05470 [Bartonella apihabitans]|uniref:hypothetical protein n=1 Tax=uncultured Bartonella sp. TaxID=104108 RepID=UPI0025D93A8F|nr:hypothetical protein [Bartonella apihabitans]WLT09583.1 hypothetical protein RAM19_05470 [Bartonella apihabitans]